MDEKPDKEVNAEELVKWATKKNLTLTQAEAQKLIDDADTDGNHTAHYAGEYILKYSEILTDASL